jgi:hypothetical protein
MKQVSTGFFPSIAFQERESTPMYRRLYDWFRSAILTGELRLVRNSLRLVTWPLRRTHVGCIEAISVKKTKISVQGPTIHSSRF